MSTAKTTAGVFAGFLLLIAVCALLALGGWAWMYITAEPKGIAEAERQIESAPSRIANYEHFYDLCAEVQGLEASLSAQRVALEATGSESERERLRSNIAGLTAQRARTIARYNADARKSYTRARFLGQDLPRSLDLNQEKTTCDY